MTERRVVITGMGILSSLGSSPKDVTDALRAGRSGVGILPERKELGFRSALSGKLVDFEPLKLPKKNERQMGYGGKMAVTATRAALDDAGLDEELVRHDRTGVIVGNSGNMHDIYENCYTFNVLKKKLSGMALPKTMASSVSANLSVFFGTRGQCMTISTACASGATSIAHATTLIRAGMQDRIIAGGIQESSWEIDCNFDALRVFSTREDEPEKASRPFDKSRDGLVPSCGAGIVVLENYEDAVSRGATIYAEVAGHAGNSDGYDMTTGSGIGSIKCMQAALKDAGISPGDVDYINAHATSTPVGDAVEAESIAAVFGSKPLVSSTKSMTGHEVAAAGSNELIYTLLMMREGFVAPSINIEEVDERCAGVTIVANDAVDASLDIAMSNSFGFGGVNASLIVRRLG